MKKIALEEHFITSDFLEYTQKSDFAAMNPKCANDFKVRLLDFDDLRIHAMDEADIEISVLSLTDPGVQGELDAGIAVKLAHKTNAFLAEKISKNPKRFRGFATLALQDPSNAAKELERCIRDYQFLGALINGQTHGHYLDEEQYYPFWEKVEQLNVPIYLHPGSPRTVPQNYKDHHELAGALWGWTVETGTHALRLVFSGLFDRFPGVKLILGHMGEALPYLLWRLDSRWNIIKHPINLKMPPSQYFKENFYITTAGVCSNGPLTCAIQELGEERVMFSVDYPYESSDVAAQFIEHAPISEIVREKICYKNAQTILKLEDKKASKPLLAAK
jgi:2,3-dihydroxybenzoate decarboxylase